MTAPPELAEELRLLEEKLADEHAGRWFPSIEPEFLSEILRSPIEDWMVFLRPDQQEMVERDHDGPARVLGPAGTGKTVIGLHRARNLSQRNRSMDQAERKPVLFSTFVNSLPPVLEKLFLRMPDTRPGEVEFASVGQLASSLCEEAGLAVRVREDETWKLLASIYGSRVRTGTPLGDIDFSEEYLKSEITKVIKGRGLQTLDEYLVLDRTGRLVTLDEPQRNQVWEIMLEWDAAKQARGWMHHCDVVPPALAAWMSRVAPRN